MKPLDRRVKCGATSPSDGCEAAQPTTFRGLKLTLTILVLLPLLADCTDTSSGSGISTSRTLVRESPVGAVALEGERPGCRKEFPMQYRGISCAGYNYDPPPIPFGELYPPR
jgi:hypothetical protein